MFLVITMPRSLEGFCVQASIDTGHKHPDDASASPAARHAYSLRTVDFSDPPCLGGTIMPPQEPGGGGGGSGGGGGGHPPDDEGPGFSFIVTRRVVQACGQFTAQDQLTLQKLPVAAPHPPHVFLGEAFIPTRAMARTIARMNTGGAPEGGFDDCQPATAAAYNYNMSRMSKAMVTLFSADAASPKTLRETTTFKSLLADAAIQLDVDLETLHKLDYLSADEMAVLHEHRVRSVSDLFAPSSENISSIGIGEIRDRILRTER
jgi:hypothetical protein